MLPSTRLTLKAIPPKAMISALMTIALALLPLSSLAGEDTCREKGIYIGNHTMIDLWYARNGGPCTIWIHGHILSVKPEDTVIIYSDMTCKTHYCPKNPTYDIYESYDVNRNCRVRILPDCVLSDM